MMKMMPEKVKIFNLIELAVFKYKRDILYRKYTEITGNAETDLNQHGMNICVPEEKTKTEQVDQHRPKAFPLLRNSI